MNNPVTGAVEINLRTEESTTESREIFFNPSAQEPFRLPSPLLQVVTFYTVSLFVRILALLSSCRGEQLAGYICHLCRLWFGSVGAL